MIDWLVTYITQILSWAGYPGLFVLMTAESMVTPVPSEAVMPFAGFLLSTGEMTWGAVILWSSLGSLIGSLLSYWIGYYGGRPLVLRFGHYLLLNEGHLLATEKFFTHFGDKTVFLSRFIPVVRHLISIPAGIGKMSLVKFSLYTIAGATIWNAFLTFVGFYLGQNWKQIENYTKYIDWLILLVILLGLAWWFKKRIFKI